MPITALRSGKTFEPNIDPPESRENQRISSLAQELLDPLRKQELLVEQEEHRLEPVRIQVFEEDSLMYCCDFFCMVVLIVILVYLSSKLAAEEDWDYWEWLP